MIEKNDLKQLDNESKSFNEVSKDGSMNIPVMEEHLKVDTQIVEAGRVRIHKNIKEEDAIIKGPVVEEEVEVVRVPINEYVQSAPESVRYEGDKMIISVMKEVVVVEKRLMLVEELHVTKRKVESQSTQSVTLRKEEVTFERL